MDQTTGRAVAGQQIAEAMTAEHESLSLECRADPARFERLLAPDFHEFGASGARLATRGPLHKWPRQRIPKGNRSG